MAEKINYTSRDNFYCSNVFLLVNNYLVLFFCYRIIPFYTLTNIFPAIYQYFVEFHILSKEINIIPFNVLYSVKKIILSPE